MNSIPKAPSAGRWALMFVSAALLNTGALAQGSPGTAAAPAKPAASAPAAKTS